MKHERIVRDNGKHHSSRLPNFSPSEQRWLRAHGEPERLQQVLDTLPYRCEDGHLPAVCALRDWRAHCFDGALLAAAALRRRGYRPHIIDLCAVRDDDHLLCAYQWRGCWGAVAKSNFPGLRYREPIFRTPRELVLSYVELYFNLKGEKSLRRYSKPVPLPALPRLDWECDTAAPELLLHRIADAAHYSIYTTAQERRLARMDARLYRSQMIGVDLDGAHGGARAKKRIAMPRIARPR